MFESHLDLVFGEIALPCIEGGGLFDRLQVEAKTSKNLDEL
jgi:hypothetical protein